MDILFEVNLKLWIWNGGYHRGCFRVVSVNSLVLIAAKWSFHYCLCLEHNNHLLGGISRILPVIISHKTLVKEEEVALRTAWQLLIYIH